MVNYAAMLVALLLSGVAAYYSIIGLAAIFAASFWPIVIMGGSLEAAKIVATSWIYRNWDHAPRFIKYYLIAAICVLMLITSMGTFGYLSKAHMDQAVPTGAVQDKLNILDEKIRVEKENIDVNRKALKQLDEAVDQVMGRTADEKGADKAVSIRRSQQKERSRLLQEIEQAQGRLAPLNEQRIPIAADLRKVAAEVGPIKYIAELLYGQSSESVLEDAVRWVIILIVVVFDPLAITLLLAANHGIKHNTKPKILLVTETKEPDPEPVFDPFPIEPEPIPEPKSVKKKSTPRWAQKASKLIEKKKRGTIEIDKNSVMEMK